MLFYLNIVLLSNNKENNIDLNAGVRAILPGSVGVRVIDCSALDGLGEASQKLLDERGCPVDEQV